MLLRLQSVDNNHCQWDRLGKQRLFAFVLEHPEPLSLNRAFGAQQHAPAGVQDGCRPRWLPRVIFVSDARLASCYQKGPPFPSTPTTLWFGLGFLLCVQVFAQKAISPLIFVLKVKRPISLWACCWFLSEEQSWLFVPFMDGHMHLTNKCFSSKNKKRCFTSNYVVSLMFLSYSLKISILGWENSSRNWGPLCQLAYSNF